MGALRAQEQVLDAILEARRLGFRHALGSPSDIGNVNRLVLWAHKREHQDWFSKSLEKRTQIHAFAQFLWSATIMMKCGEGCLHARVGCCFHVSPNRDFPLINVAKHFLRLAVPELGVARGANPWKIAGCW